MNQEVIELFGRAGDSGTAMDWKGIVKSQHCPYLNRKCIKVRKSNPSVSIGTCTVRYGERETPVMICPFRLLERRQVFTDCLHLLTLHEPGNELHIVPEISVPGGSVDYFVVSAHKRKPVDFVGVELQTLDTTGTVWPARQRFLRNLGIKATDARIKSGKSYGMNWKMTAKTILVQLHHKIETFEHLSKHLVLAVQDHLLEYMEREFALDHLNKPRQGDSLHIHAYSLEQHPQGSCLQLTDRRSTDAAGIAKAMGLQAQARVELDVILTELQRKISDKTLWAPIH
jgi:hypothetical protein